VAHERRATADRPPDPRPHGVGDRGGRPRPLGPRYLAAKQRWERR